MTSSGNQLAKVAIIGGGVSGLSAAYFLEQLAGAKGLAIDLFEASDRLGGKIFTHRQDDMVLELGAESFLARKPSGVDLCRRLGLGDKLRGTRPENKRTYVWHDGRLHRLPEGLSGFVPGKLSGLASTSLLSFGGKLRVGLDLVLPADGSASDESLASFISRRLGRQAYERLVQPLLCGIYCGDGEQLSLAATYPELRQLEREHGSLIRGLRKRKPPLMDGKSLPPFVTLSGGMSELIDALRARLSRTNLRSGTRVTSIEPGANVRLTLANAVAADNPYAAVILATSAKIASRILGAAAPSLSRQLAAIPHVSTATVNLWFDAATLAHRLDGYGFVIPSHEQSGMTAVTWTSSKHFDRATPTRKLIRAYVGRAGAELDAETPDSEVIEVVRRELARTMGIETAPAGVRVQRWPDGSPQYTLGHLDRLAAIDKQLDQRKGIFLCGASYRGVGIPDCICDAERTAESVFRFVTQTPNKRS